MAEREQGLGFVGIQPEGAAGECLRVLAALVAGEPIAVKVGRLDARPRAPRGGGVGLEFSGLAPEILRDSPFDRRADLYSLGVVLFELLTGQRPFRGETAQAVAYAILNEQPATITELRPDLPPEIDRIIKKMLRKDPLQRYATTDEVIAELEVLKTPSSGSGRS